MMDMIMPTPSALPSSRRPRRRRSLTPAELEAAINRLQVLERADLLQRWTELYGCAPPHKISRKLLIRALSFRMQEEQHGPLAPSLRRRLARIAQDLRERGDAAITSLPRIKPGTRFVREWQGTLHQVTVTPNGFEWQGRSHRSLSEIARLITGTRWNGWTFFGARSRRRRREGEAPRSAPEPGLATANGPGRTMIGNPSGTSSLPEGADV